MDKAGYMPIFLSSKMLINRWQALRLDNVMTIEEKTNISAPLIRFAGVILIVEALFSILAMLHHPEVTSTTAVGAVSQISEFGGTARIVHAMMIAFLILNYYAITVFARAVHRKDRDMSLGLVIYSFAAVAMVGGPLISGFIMTSLADRYATFPPADQTVFKDLGRLAGASNQALEKFGTLGYAVAMVIWSVSLVRTSGFLRIVGICGLIIGTILSAAMILGYELDVHGMTVVVMLLALWYVLVAAWLLRASRPIN